MGLNTLAIQLCWGFSPVFPHQFPHTVPLPVRPYPQILWQARTIGLRQPEAQAKQIQVLCPCLCPQPRAPMHPLMLPWQCAHSHRRACPYLHCHCHVINVAGAATGTRTPPGHQSSLRGCNNAPPEGLGVQECIAAPCRRVLSMSGIAARGRKGVFTPSGQQGQSHLYSIFLLSYSCSTT